MKNINNNTKTIKNYEEFFNNFLINYPVMYKNEVDNYGFNKQKKIFNDIKIELKNNTSFNIIKSCIEQIYPIFIFKELLIKHIYKLVEYDFSNITNITYNEWIFIWGKLKTDIEICYDLLKKNNI